jgi:uncharacterized protein (DUF2267 family)
MPVLTYEGFIATVQRAAQIPGEEAERAACATLRTLSERLSAGETEDVAGRLPDQLRSCLSGGGERTAFHAAEFLRRVAERAGVDEPAARRDARAVFSTLFRAVGPEEFADVRAELPDDFDPLLDDALRDASTLTTAETEARAGISADQFLERVADRLDVDRERARRASDAVLEVLAIRLSGGHVSELGARLPPELRPALQRGLSDSGLQATALSLDDFLRAIARREDTSMDAAAGDVRAVLTTLREAVGEREFEDTASQLPGEYAPLLQYQG